MSRLVVLCSALALLLAACAGASDAPTQTAQATVAGDIPQETASEVELQPTTEPAAEPEPEPVAAFVSPIGEALGVAQEDVQQAQIVYLDEAEELVRQCMTQAGFDYIPVSNALDESTKRLGELESSLSDEAFTEQYGYGIATLFELDFQGNGVLNFVNDQFGPAPSEPRSPGEQAAYEIALTGESLQGLSTEDAQDQLFGDNNFEPLEGSCRAYGYDTAENPGAVYDGLFSLLGDELASLGERFESDQRVRDARQSWQVCMAELGHSYENPDEIRNELFGRANDLATQYLSSQQVLTALGEAQQVGFTLMDGDERYDFLNRVGALQGFSWVPQVHEQVDALITFELTVANDSLGCSDVDTLEAVQFELETEFVQTYSAQLALITAGES